MLLKNTFARFANSFEDPSKEFFIHIERIEQIVEATKSNT